MIVRHLVGDGERPGADLAVYQARLPLSTTTVRMVADLIKGRIRAIVSRWRKLPPGRAAVIVLAVLRHNQRLVDLAGGNAISVSAVRRRLLEVVEKAVCQDHLGLGHQPDSHEAGQVLE